ncbi:hypothetical protein J7L01_05540 [bacterium]|nr:hypothetical protein [bacterium]
MFIPKILSADAPTVAAAQPPVAVSCRRCRPAQPQLAQYAPFDRLRERFFSW